jgi:hypothetical protein
MVPLTWVHLSISVVSSKPFLPKDKIQTFSKHIKYPLSSNVQGRKTIHPVAE